MMQWISENAMALQVVVSVVSALIWLVYLQLILLGFLRQRRPEILVSRGAGVGLEARCYIANLGFEPIYVSQLLMSVEVDGEKIHAAITDRENISEEQMRDPSQATNQGPVKTGDSFDAGSFRELVRRALRANDRDEETPIDGLHLTVVAIHAASSSFIGAQRRYICVPRGDHHEIVPETLSTQQIRSPLGRWRLKRQLRRDLSWYRR